MIHWSFFIVFGFGFTKLGYEEPGGEVNSTEDVMSFLCWAPCSAQVFLKAIAVPEKSLMSQENWPYTWDPFKVTKFDQASL